MLCHNHRLGSAADPFQFLNGGGGGRLSPNSRNTSAALKDGAVGSAVNQECYLKPNAIRLQGLAAARTGRTTPPSQTRHAPSKRIDSRQPFFGNVARKPSTIFGVRLPCQRTMTSSTSSPTKSSWPAMQMNFPRWLYTYPWACSFPASPNSAHSDHAVASRDLAFSTGSVSSCIVILGASGIHAAWPPVWMPRLYTRNPQARAANLAAIPHPPTPLPERERGARVTSSP